MLILHGDNQIASRETFITQVKLAQGDNKHIVEFAGTSFGMADLIQSVESSSLFGQTSLTILEGFFSSRPSNAKKEITSYLSAHSDSDILIWESKDVTAQLKDFSSNVIKKFDFPKHLFQFLDNPAIPSLHQTLTSLPAEMIFASLVTRMHKQLMAGNYALRTKYLSLLDLEYKLKTGLLPYDLTTGLELWLSS